MRYKFSTGYQEGKVLSKRFFINVLLVGNSIHAHITTLNQQMYRPYKVNLSGTGVDYSGSLNFKNVFIVAMWRKMICIKVALLYIPAPVPEV